MNIGVTACGRVAPRHGQPSPEVLSAAGVFGSDTAMSRGPRRRHVAARANREGRSARMEFRLHPVS